MWFEDCEEALVWLELEHTKTLQKGSCLRLWWLSTTSVSVFCNISHITCTSSYPQVCTSSWSFTNPAPPFLRWLIRVDRARHRRLTGKIIVCQICINLLSLTTLPPHDTTTVFFFFFFHFLFFPCPCPCPCLCGNTILFDQASAASSNQINLATYFLLLLLLFSYLVVYMWER